MDDGALWNRMRETWASLGEIIDQAVEPIIAESGLEGRGWGLLLAVLTFEPENTTPSHLMVRSPYTAAEEFLVRLSMAAGLGFLEEVSAGEFALTPAGRTAVHHFIETARRAMVEADPLPRNDSRRLADLLDRLVRSSLETQPSPRTWSIRLSYKLMPAPEPVLPYIEQAITCLASYRDDAHLAVWRDSDLAATSWEVLTLIWRKEASSLSELKDQLLHRGHPTQVYESALEELRLRGFLAGTNEDLHLTSTGQSYREEVEAETDRHFFTPWASLEESEKDEMAELLSRLRDGLRA